MLSLSLKGKESNQSPDADSFGIGIEIVNARLRAETPHFGVQARFTLHPHATSFGAETIYRRVGHYSFTET